MPRRVPPMPGFRRRSLCSRGERLAGRSLGQSIGCSRLLFAGFNRVFDVTIEGYGRVVSFVLRVSFVLLLVYGGLMGLTYLGFQAVPVGFIPDQDKGYLVVNVQLPDAPVWNAAMPSCAS